MTTNDQNVGCGLLVIGGGLAGVVLLAVGMICWTAMKIWGHP